MNNMFDNKFNKSKQSWPNFSQKYGKWEEKQQNIFYYSQKFKRWLLPVRIENKKIFLILCSTLEGLSIDTSLKALRWLYRSTKIDWTKKPSWLYNSSALHKLVGTKIAGLNEPWIFYFTKGFKLKTIF